MNCSHNSSFSSESAHNSFNSTHYSSLYNPLPSQNNKPPVKTGKDFYTLLPLKISNMTIKKLSWDEFKGEPNQQEKYNAHIFWNIGYTYDLKIV